MKLGNVELKVAVPVVATALTGTLGAALYRVVLSFGLFHPTTGQSLALAGVGAAALPVIAAVTGYATPHTPRPDVTDPGASAVAGDGATSNETGGSLAGTDPGVSPQPQITMSANASDFAAKMSEARASIDAPPADAYPDTPPAAGGSVAVPFAQQETRP